MENTQDNIRIAKKSNIRFHPIRYTHYLKSFSLNVHMFLSSKGHASGPFSAYTAISIISANYPEKLPIAIIYLKRDNLPNFFVLSSTKQ